MSRIRIPGWAKRSSIALLGVGVLGAGVLVGVGSASGDQSDLAAGVSPAKLNTAKLAGKVSPSLAAARGKVTAFVQFTSQPAVDAFNAEKSKGKAQAKAAAKRAKQDVASTSSAVVGKLRSSDPNTKVLYQTSNAVPGVVVQADAAHVRALASLPQVASVRTVVPKTRSNSSAVQLTKTLNTWQQTHRYGEGVRIGVIDDGIDYTHADFGGPGTPAAYTAIDPTKVDPSYFPTEKVAGGTDLAGNDYDAASDDPAKLVPHPDPNPLACGEHGTHVSGTIGGYGVNADGSTFTGNYGDLTAAKLDAMRIGPGTAPEATLYGIKVFGCEGSTNLTAQAMDWALDPDGDGDFTDHLDVVNMSLGSDFGAPDDPDSLFVRKLTQNGVLPVISAGNGNDLYDVGGSPGSTPEALTVASTRDAYVLRDAAEVKAPANLAGPHAGQYSQDYAHFDTLDLTGPVVKMSDQANLDGCKPFNAADKAAVAGKLVWLEWDDNDSTRKCGSAGRDNNAQAAGAKGVLLSSQLNQFSAGIAGNAEVPMFQFTRDETAKIRPALDAGTLQVHLAGNLRTTLKTMSPEITDTPSSFTSRGVRGPAVKPDVAAPGDTIASALRGSGNQTLVISGTSMAAPHTTGITALVRQAHPDWTPEEVKAAVMNTADGDVHAGENASGPLEAPNRVGAGRIDALSALDNTTLAMVKDDPGAVSVGFGTVEVAKPTTLSKTIKVVNKSSNPVEYDVAYQGITTLPGVTYTVSANHVKLSPRGIATVRVTLSIADPAALRKVADPTVQKLQNDLPRQFLADASGLVKLTPTAGATVGLRVPVYSAPKPVAAVTTPDGIKFRGNDTQTVLNLGGRGLNQGSGDQRYQSLVSVMELQASSPKLPKCTKRTTSNCTINDTAKGGDLRYVGVASTAPLAKAQGHPENALLAFGIATWGDWYNLGSNTIPYVDFDVTGDNNPDFETYVTKLTGTDVLVAATVDLKTGDTVDLEALNGLLGDVDANVFDTNVAVLPVAISTLGIDPSAASARITYTVGTAGYYVAPGNDNGNIDQMDGTASFDVLAPGLWVQGGGDPALSYVAQPGTALVVNRNQASLDKDGALGLLAIEHHNASGHRADVIKVAGAKPGSQTKPGHHKKPRALVVTAGGAR
ncbi:S8 family serine peptidase [Labedaea rhizosphaerae]|uniref:Subtilase family protein n=1 Tax=Labedaea rhizosphaerae TaxID=598644 RepID=A0A4R6SDM9_LABRH|nr:S8 family serine peptidase [Labedaea rhizosphaerae]TDP98060.1 subtilase family protein [Labedaea rhizosphaerae]